MEEYIERAASSAAVVWRTDGSTDVVGASEKIGVQFERDDAHLCSVSEASATSQFHAPKKKEKKS